MSKLRDMANKAVKQLTPDGMVSSAKSMIKGPEPSPDSPPSGALLAGSSVKKKKKAKIHGAYTTPV